MMVRRRPTRADVAERAGVSPSTVTLVLQNKADALRITVSTQERVRQAARDIGYVPNQHIQAVRRGKSGILGLYLRHDQYGRPYGYWTSVVWGLQMAAAEADVRILLHNAPPEATTDDIFSLQAGGLVDGALILNSQEDPIVPRLLSARIPAVEVGDPYSPLPYVGMDPESGMKMAVDYAAEKGYRSPIHLTHVSAYVANADARANAFASRCRDWGLPHENRVLKAQYGDEVVDEILAMDPAPDCCICMSDELAYELLRACTVRGIRVPGDLGIIGFDALEGYNTRVMTSMATPIRELARLALAKLRDIIDGRPYEHGTLLSHTIREGDTT